METIQFLQQFDHPLVVMVMQTVTFLGNEAFFLLVLPVVIWCWRKEDGLPLVGLLYITFLLNTGLKEAFAIPRPAEAIRMVSADGFGFPSGHAQSAVVLWGYYAWRFRTYTWVLTVVFLVGFSRIYLGVHTPVDVMGGWTIGLVTLLAGIGIIHSMGRNDAGMSYNWSLSFPPIPTAMIFGWVGAMIPLLFPGIAIVKVSGFFAGIGAGLVLEKTYVDFIPETIWWKQILKIVIGIGGAILVRSIFKWIFPDWIILDWLRYGLAGVWVGIGAPWVFKKLG